MASRFVFDLNCIDGPADAVASTARDHVTYAMTQIVEKLSMPPPPKMPAADWKPVPKNLG